MTTRDRLSPPRPLTSRDAFTLIELLTVIAIIAILAAIIIPSASRVRASAQKATCAGNLRQLATASLTYAADHKNLLPPRPRSVAGWRQPHAYHRDDFALLHPYLGEADREKILFCPGEINEWRNPSVNGYSGEDAVFGTYTYFNWPFIEANVLEGFAITATDLTRTNLIPANFPLWSCLTYTSGSSAYGHADVGTSNGAQGQNVARADGSVEWVAGDRLITYASAGGAQFYGPRP